LCDVRKSLGGRFHAVAERIWDFTEKKTGGKDAVRKGFGSVYS
jgi:hypothetical protein